MSLNDVAKQAFQEQEVGEIPIYLVTVDHASLADPIRLCSDHVVVTSRGEDYLPAVIDVSLLPQRPDQAPRVRGTIGLPDRSLASAIRSLDSSPTYTIELVLASDPDTVQTSSSNLEIIAATLHTNAVEFELGMPGLFEAVGPKLAYTPDVAPGLFR